MQTYRATFLHNIECDYWGDNKKKLQAESYNNFHDIHRKYYHIIKKIKARAIEVDVKDFWHFYEPYVEITWLSNEVQAQQIYEFIEKLLAEEKINDLKKEEGMGADWFCHSTEEREFGAKRHAISSDFVELVDNYESSIEAGKGDKAQVGRTIHTICNPLGLNYMDEAKICFSRGLICILFKYFSFNRAVWIYKNIFRQKY